MSRFTRALGALGLCIALASPAMAQRTGSYAAEGTNPDGSRYSGVVTYESMGRGTWRIVWRIPGSAPIQGSAIANGGMIAAGYVLEGAIGVVLYQEQPDGTLLGRWTTRDGGVGMERLIPR